MKKRSLLMAALITSGIGVTGLGSGAVQAYFGPAAENDLVSEIAERFNLDEDEVQQFFEEHRTERQQQMEARFEERLANLVEDTTLTEAQKEQLIQLHDQHRAEMDELRSSGDVDKEVIRELRDDHHQEILDWAEQEGLDLTTFMPMRYQHQPRGDHAGQFRGMAN